MGWPSSFVVMKYALGLFFWMPAVGKRMWWLEICTSSPSEALLLALCHLSLHTLTAFWSHTNTYGQVWLTPKWVCLCLGSSVRLAWVWGTEWSYWLCGEAEESWAGNCADASALFLVIQLVFVLCTLNFLKQLWKPQLQCLLCSFCFAVIWQLI